MNETEVTKLFTELGINNQQAATLRTILLPEARVLLDKFMISNAGNIEEETDTASTKKEEVANQDLPSEEGAPSCEDNDSASIAIDNGYTVDDTSSTNLEIEGVAYDDDASLATEDSAATGNGYTSDDTVSQDNEDSANGYTPDRTVKQRIKNWGIYQRHAISRQVQQLFDVDMTNKPGRKRCKRICNILIRMINGTTPMDEMEECNTEVAAGIVNAHRVALGFGSYVVKENEWREYSKKKKAQRKKKGMGSRGPLPDMSQPVADMSDEFTEDHKLTMIDYVNFCMDIQGKTKGKILYVQEKEEGDSATPHDKNNHAEEKGEDIQESELAVTQTEEDGDGGVTVDLYEYLIKISGEDAAILRPVLHPKARELLDELVSDGTIESTAATENMTIVEEGAVTVDLYDLLVKLSIEDATHLLPALHIKARELLEELISNGTIVSPPEEVATDGQDNKTSEKASSPTSTVDTPNDESSSVKPLLSGNTPDNTSTNLEVDFKEKCITKRSSENSLDPDVYGMTKASSEVLQKRRIVKVSRHSQKFGGGRGSVSAAGKMNSSDEEAQLHETEILCKEVLAKEKEILLHSIKQERFKQEQLQEVLKQNEIERQAAPSDEKSSDPTANALPKGSAWIPDTPKEKRPSDQPNMHPRLGNSSNNTPSQEVVKKHVTMDNSPFSNILAAVGTPLLSYLAPRELFCLGLTNHSVESVITESLFDVYHMQHQHRRRFKQLEPPITINEIDSTIDNVQVDILDQHTFSTREEIIEVLLDKIRLANLRYHRPGTFVCTDTLEVTMEQVAEDINDLSKWLHADGAWYGTFRSDPNEIWKDSTRFSVGCRIGEHGQKGRSKRCWIDYLLRTVKPHRCNIEVFLEREWARMMIAQRGMRGREWQWKCAGAEGVGYMIYKPSPHDEDKAVQDIVKSLQGRNPDMLKDNSALRQIQAHIDEKLQQIEIRFISVTPAKPANNPRSLLSAFGV